jgi:ProP effector
MTSDRNAAKSNGHDKSIAAVLELLAEMWPAAFSIYENRRRPLKVGIREEILAALDGAVTAAELSLALRVYVSNRVYRARLVAGAVRIGLDGQPAGVVTPEQIPPSPSPPSPSPPPPSPPAPSPAPSPRLTLADLRAAATRRREQANQSAVAALGGGLANQAAPDSKTRN